MRAGLPPKGSDAMGVRNTADDRKVALFDSVTGLPLAVPVFDDALDAESFVAYAEKVRPGRDLRTLTPAELDALSDEWTEARK